MCLLATRVKWLIIGVFLLFALLPHPVYAATQEAGTLPLAKVTDLAVISRGDTSLTLTWTAPGGDGLLGTASQYDIRYSTWVIDTEASWEAATIISDPPTPQAAGSTETFTVTKLSPGTRYYFALKTADEVLNWSDLSNSPLGITSSPISYEPEYVYFAGQTSLWGKISPSGVILRSVAAESFDGLLILTIDKGTIALTRYGTPLRWIGMYKMKGTPSPPEAARILSLMYDLQPERATFDPPATLTYSYDPGHIPEDVNEEDLVVASYDGSIGEWANLDSVVDTEANIITAKVGHFTPFAVLAYKITVPPAIFERSALSISPSEVNIGEIVTISLLVANTGGEPGWYVVTLKINGKVEATKYVTLAAGTSKPVSFTTVKNTAGIYSVFVCGLSSSFTVVAPEAEVILPAPAAFSVSSLAVEPAGVKPGEAVAVSIVVANIGGESGSYIVVLKISGVKEDEKSVTIAAGGTETVAFSVTREDPGNYTVDVDGLSGSFTVVAPVVVPPAKPGINWPLIGGIIGGVIVVGLIIFFLKFRRRLGVAIRGIGSKQGK